MLRDLGVKEFSKGRLYSSGNSKSFTAIQTGIGPGLSGDAALYLAETQCQNIILFGSCGLVKEEKDIDIGSLVVPEECYSLESFTEMLLQNKNNWQAFYGDKTLAENFLKVNKDIKKPSTHADAKTDMALKLKNQVDEEIKKHDGSGSQLNLDEVDRELGLKECPTCDLLDCSFRRD